MFVGEVIVVILSLMNLGVPGSYRQFWQSECIYLAIAGSLALFSVFLERRETIQDGRKPIRHLERPQILVLTIPLGLWLLGIYFLLMHFK
ncbi:hypothetical protein HDF10_003632 [Edaphobacter lichenicola]|uniref:Uncharacterized protein n=1 Tax=Tunturiibacter lichenicola TaxID=2051959 RepID=A0A7W8JAD9_9BACT|nr:hypothetical protein [Edaphobacter lichenicola]